MTIEDVKAIIQGDETRTLEMKKTTGELKDGMRSACAFLNTAGGWLFFGIAPTTLKILRGDRQHSKGNRQRGGKDGAIDCSSC